MADEAIRVTTFRAGYIPSLSERHLPEGASPFCSNVHLEREALVSRLGMQAFGSPAPGTPILGGFFWRKPDGSEYRLIKAAGSLYNLGTAGSWTPIGALSNADQYASFAVLNKWCFIADGGTVVKTDGSAMYPAGIVAPLGTPIIGTAAPGGEMGTASPYNWRYTFYSTLYGEESNCGPPMGSAFNTGTAQAYTGTIPADPAWPGSHVDQVWYYRTKAFGSAYFFEGSASYAGTPVPVTLQLADDALGKICPINNDPHGRARWLKVHQRRLFSTGDESEGNRNLVKWTEPDRPDVQPVLNAVNTAKEAGWPNTGLAVMFRKLVAATRNQCFELEESALTEFRPDDLPPDFGVLSGYTPVEIENMFLALADKGRVFAFNNNTFENISWQIKAFLQKDTNKNRLQKSWAAYHNSNERNWYALLLPLAGQDQKTVMMVYDLDIEGWWRFDLGVALNVLFPMRSVAEDDWELWAGGYDGQVYRMDRPGVAQDGTAQVGYDWRSRWYGVDALHRHIIGRGQVITGSWPVEGTVTLVARKDFETTPYYRKEFVVAAGQPFADHRFDLPSDKMKWVQVGLEGTPGPGQVHRFLEIDLVPDPVGIEE